MRVAVLAVKIILQFYRDKRTLLLMLLAPLLVLTLVHLILDHKEDSFHVGGYHLPDEMTQQLETKDIKVTEFSNADAKQHIDDDQMDAFISFTDQHMKVTLDGSQSKNEQLLQIITAEGNQQKQPAEISYAYGKEDLSTFDYTGPTLIGLFIFFFVFLIAGISFLRERTNGTLDRILSTPLRRWEIVAGYGLGFGLFTTLQSLLITWYAVQILGLYQDGSFWLVLLVTVMLSLTALTLGTFLSAFANNELQLIQFVPLVIVPQVFFSGLFPMDSLASWLQSLQLVMPLYYGADALQLIMMKGQGVSHITSDLLILAGFTILFALLNILILKKYRRL
ncbi:ABC transporter permease [Bacillus vallismortis]|uniref:ABC transporter permease n=1 Tax=Bacillus TaxID=1386 RepID=UPI0025A080AF|nr:ABC transporter permease [Bacillus subtilis]MDM5300934.1 ABC transporter permease [Bacillus subtilis]MDM5322987.1 ABC transporter permease [Bacillus subtilis]